jgi:hypothetical protein
MPTGHFIAKRYIGRMHKGHGNIPGGRSAQVASTAHQHGGREFASDRLGGSICRAVIDDDDRPTFRSLLLQPTQCLEQPGPPIVRDDN